MKKKLMKIEKFVNVMKNRQDSFWYDGQVAEVTYGDRRVCIHAEGDIRIYNKAGELVHDGKERGPGFKGFKLKMDKDLKKIGNSYDDKYRWENNNWFELSMKIKQSGVWNDVDCESGIADDYDAAIKNAKETLKDDKWWKDVEQDQANSFVCKACGTVYTEESGAFRGFICDECRAKVKKHR